MPDTGFRSLHGRGLQVGYGKAIVLDRADIAVPPGVTVLLGANGAGKSTLMRALSGAIAPCAGTVSFEEGGAPATRGQLERCVTIMPQVFTPVKWLTAREYVQYAAVLGGVPRGVVARRVDDTLDRVDLRQRDSRSTELSGGTQRRLALAAALVTEPAVLLLDEPTAGLDPIQREAIHALIQDVGREAAVLVSTHLAEDLEELGERVAVLAQGTVAFAGTLPELKALGGGSGSTSSIAAALRALHARRSDAQ